jgi:hypothetical protein
MGKLLIKGELNMYYTVYSKNGKIEQYTKHEFIDHLIETKQVKWYQFMNPRFKKETKLSECPVIYKTRSGYVYAVIN